METSLNPRPRFSRNVSWFLLQKGEKARIFFENLQRTQHTIPIEEGAPLWTMTAFAQQLVIDSDLGQRNRLQRIAKGLPT